MHVGPAGTPGSCSLVFLALEALAMAHLIPLPSTHTLRLVSCISASTLLTIGCLILVLLCARSILSHGLYKSCSTTTNAHGSLLKMHHTISSAFFSLSIFQATTGSQLLRR